MCDLSITSYIPVGREAIAIDISKRQKHEYNLQWFVGILGQFKVFSYISLSTFPPL